MHTPTSTSTPTTSAAATLSRRQAIRAGAAVLALPFLASLQAGEPAAREAGPPRRLVAVCTAFGLYGPSFFPEAPGRGYQASEYLAVLGDLRERITVFSGISHPEIGGDHASEACFLSGAKHPTAGGFRNSVSLDYLASTHVANATRFPLLCLGTDDAFPLTHTASGAGVPGLNQPSQVYARLFLAGSKQDVEQEMARLRRGESILDHMGAGFSALKTRLGRQDQQQVADYSEAVREMEKQLHADEAWAVRPKPMMNEPAPPDSHDKSDAIGRAAAMLKLTRLALLSDSTRVVSLFIRGMDLKPPIAGVSEDHHGLSHHGRNPAKIEQLRIIERTEMAAFRDFLTALSTTKDGGTSLLDQTQVLIGSNLGDASGHGTSNLPILLAGGGWKHGQHIAGDRNNNTPLARLYISMLQRFGMEIDSFAECTGTLPELS
jgi:hypothetical protein